MATQRPRTATLIGDSIRMGYQPLVVRALSGRVDVWSDEQNGGDSRNVLANLEQWALARPADVLHVNCGLHDLKLLPEGYQVPLEEYVKNIHAIMDKLAEKFRGRVIWATTTPVIDERHQKVKPFERHEEDVRRYNEAALSVMQSHKVAVNDLHEVIVKAGPAVLLGEDGVHFNERGKEVLAEAVAAAILDALG